MYKCVQKFSSDKIKEFMEIQLIHANELYMKFLNFFEKTFEGSSKENADE